MDWMFEAMDRLGPTGTWILFGVIATVLNLALLAAAVAVVVWVLRVMGVIA